MRCCNYRPLSRWRAVVSFDQTQRPKLLVVSGRFRRLVAGIRPRVIRNNSATIDLGFAAVDALVVMVSICTHSLRRRTCSYQGVFVSNKYMRQKLRGFVQAEANLRGKDTPPRIHLMHRCGFAAADRPFSPVESYRRLPGVDLAMKN